MANDATISAWMTLGYPKYPILDPLGVQISHYKPHVFQKKSFNDDDDDVHDSIVGLQ